MTGLCGWIGEHGARGVGDAVCARMAAALPAAQGESAVARHRAEAGAALAAALEAPEGWYEGEGVLAAIVGYPRWPDEPFRTLAAASGAAAALAAAWRAHGPDLLAHVRGEFALAVIEPASGRAVLAADRFGIRPLVYARRPGGGLVFGSSTDAVAAHPGVGATVSPQTVYDFLWFSGRIPAPYAIYDEQRKLIPGECLVCEGGRIETRRYWSMPYEEAVGADATALGEELRRRLHDSVAAAVAAERGREVGAFLSGGLDSSAVAGFFAGCADGAAKTFTIGFDVAGYDESGYARIAAAHFGTRHFEHVVTPEDVFNAIPTLAAAFDEPHANSSAVPAYYCARLARENGVEVMLAGDGGDELFAGNSRYVEDLVFEPYAALPAPLRRRVIEPLLAALPDRAPLDLVRRLRNYARIGAMPLGVRMFRHNTFWSVAPDEILAPDALAAVDRTRPERLLEAIYDETPGGDKVQAMMHVDLRITIADSDLRKVCGACAAAGTRVRFPMLDDDLAEFAAGIPSAMLMRDGRLRAFYKEAMTGFLPAAVIQKKKHGFGLPLLDHLRRYAPSLDLAGDTLQALKARALFRDECLDGVVAELRGDGPGRYGMLVWDLLMLELWLQSRHDRLPSARLESASESASMTA